MPDTDTTKQEAPVDPEVKVDEGAGKEPETTTTEGVITEADRTKYGIPAKFKDWASVAKWGSEAEKGTTRLAAEKGELERKNKEYEEMLLALKEDKTDKSGISTEEKEQMAARFQEDFTKDPIGTMQKLFAEFKNNIQSEGQKSAQVSKWEKEEAEISSDPAYKDIWASEVKPELIKIAKERPYLNSLEEVLAIYERNKGKINKFNKDDTEEKKKEKERAASETGRGAGGASEDLLKKIASAKSNKELEELASKIK